MDTPAKSDGNKNEFVYSFKTKGVVSTLKVPVPIPLNIDTREFVGRLVGAHDLPCFVEEELSSSIGKYVEKETEKLYMKEAESLLKSLEIAGDEDIGSLADAWAHDFSQEDVAHAPEIKSKPEVEFAEIYHRLIHSPALDTLFNLEHTYAVAIQDVVSERDRTISKLQTRQQQEMEKAVKNLDFTHDELHVNMLASRHFENIQREEARWDSELCNLQKTQREEFKQWVTKLDEEMAKGNEGPTSRRIRAMSDSLPLDNAEEVIEQPRLEESFTAHLGAQMKTMHNLRLMSVDILDLCRHTPSRAGGRLQPQPQRLQTAMSLYSNSLAALVLMVDDRINSYTGIKRDFANVCQQSTDFHFPDLDTQLRIIQQHAVQANLRREVFKETKGSNGEMTESPASSPNSGDQISNLKTGDFYVTRHSNLSEVHLVFHLVSDERIRSPETRSQHPVILSIRNIFKLAVDFDIQFITLPLFLVYEMYEDMTIPWCLKRAELVFKCAKGFMIEMAALGGNESITVQFVVPKDISDDLFSQLCAMLPSIFKMSRTLDLTRSK